MKIEIYNKQQLIYVSRALGWELGVDVWKMTRELVDAQDDPDEMYSVFESYFGNYVEVKRNNAKAKSIWG